MRDYFLFKKKDTKRAVFLDRDGTINIDTVMAYKKSDYMMLDGCIEALSLVSELDIYIFIVTNQSGIALGRYSSHDMSSFNKLIVDDFVKNNIELNGIYYCPHYDEKNLPEGHSVCLCSKPMPGLLLEALCDFDICFDDSIIIGDKPSDIGAGINAGIKNTILVTTGIYKNGSYLGERYADRYKPRYVVPDILQAASIVKDIFTS